MTKDNARKFPWFAVYLALVGVVIAGALVFLGWAMATEHAAAEHCASLGAVAVEGAGETWVCVVPVTESD